MELAGKPEHFIAIKNGELFISKEKNWKKNIFHLKIVKGTKIFCPFLFLNFVNLKNILLHRFFCKTTISKKGYSGHFSKNSSLKFIVFYVIKLFLCLHPAPPQSNEKTTNCDYPFKDEGEEKEINNEENNPERTKSFVPQKDSSLLDSSSDDENDEEEVLYRDDTFVSHASTESESDVDYHQKNEGKSLSVVLCCSLSVIDLKCFQRFFSIRLL